jgi:hypothetical protein
MITHSQTKNVPGDLDRADGILAVTICADLLHPVTSHRRTADHDFYRLADTNFFQGFNYR